MQSRLRWDNLISERMAFVNRWSADILERKRAGLGRRALPAEPVPTGTRRCRIAAKKRLLLARGTLLHRSPAPLASLLALACLALAGCGGGTVHPSASGGGTNSTTGNSNGAAYTISGAVSGAANVTVKLSGSATSSTSTDTSGTYSFAALGNGTYTITPSETGYVFSPASRAASVSDASLSSVGFAATPSNALTYRISGTVSGAIAAGVIITLNGVNVGSATTDLDGNYNFSGLVSGTYTVSASLQGFSFTRAVIVTLGTVDSASNNFTSMVSPTGSNLMFTPANPLPQAIVGLPYAETIINNISGGTAPYYYQSSTMTTGTPPLGMIVNPNGELTGTPQYPGQYDFSVCATDSIGNTTAPCGATSVTVVPVPTATPAPAVTFTAQPTSITSGSSSTLTWSSTNATSCAASGSWTGPQGTSGTQAVSPMSSTSYSLTCTGVGGTTAASVQVTVNGATPEPTPTVTLTANPIAIATGGASTLTWSSINAASCTASGGWTGPQATSGTYPVSPTSTTTYTLTCTGAGGTTRASVQVTVNPSTSASTSWVYHNGLFDWPGDYSFDAVPGYQDTSGHPLSGLYDIKVTITSPWGGWLPYAQNWDFNSKPYTKLTFALKPTVANQQWHVYFVKVGDVPVGISVEPAQYGPAPVAGKWATYTIPLADLGVLGAPIYKFAIQDETGLATNVWYVDNVGFVP
jgi:hypothetical protein